MSIKLTETKEELEATNLEVPNVKLDKSKAMESLEDGTVGNLVEPIQSYNIVTLDNEALSLLMENFAYVYGGD